MRRPESERRRHGHFPCPGVAEDRPSGGGETSQFASGLNLSTHIVFPRVSAPPC